MTISPSISVGYPFGPGAFQEWVSLLALLGVSSLLWNSSEIQSGEQLTAHTQTATLCPWAPLAFSMQDPVLGKSTGGRCQQAAQNLPAL